MSPSKKQTSAYLDFYLWQTPYTRRNHLYWIPNLNCYQAKARPSILLISPNELIRFYRRLISNQILPIIIGSAPGLGNRGNSSPNALLSTKSNRSYTLNQFLTALLQDPNRQMLRPVVACRVGSSWTCSCLGQGWRRPCLYHCSH